jgi:hypothetical protein
MMFMKPTGVLYLLYITFQMKKKFNDTITKIHN